MSAESHEPPRSPDLELMAQHSASRVSENPSALLDLASPSRQETQLDKAQRFLHDHSLRKNSLARLCCLLTLDLLLVTGFCLALYFVIQDEEYWQEAPYPFHIFLLVQYALIALLIRVPISSFRAAISSGIVCVLSVLLKVNIGLGFYFLYHMRDEGFQLKDGYHVAGLVLIVVPTSIIVFLFIVLVKILCFYLAD